MTKTRKNIQYKTYKTKEDFDKIKRDDTKSKKCSVCKVSKTLDNYRTIYHPERKSGFYIDGTCTNCRNLQGKKSYYKHWDKINKRHKEYRDIKAKEKREKEKLDKLNFIGPKIPENWRICKTCNIIQYIDDFVTCYINRKYKLHKCNSCERKRRKISKSKPKNKIREQVSANVRQNLERGGCKKDGPVIKYLGCNMAFFKEYIEKQFEPWMNWNNYGRGYAIDKKGYPIYDNDGLTILLWQWNYDHITPCEDFDFNNPEDIEKCFHYSNWRPLLAHDNYSKSDFLPDGTRARNKNS